MILNIVLAPIPMCPGTSTASKAGSSGFLTPAANKTFSSDEMKWRLDNKKQNYPNYHYEQGK
jgi:hypothetical protein